MTPVFISALARFSNILPIVCTALNMDNDLKGRKREGQIQLFQFKLESGNSLALFRNVAKFLDV